MPTRRRLLRTGATLLGAAAAGCLGGGDPSWARLEVAVRDSFEGTGQVAAPVAVEMKIASHGTRRAGVRDLTVVALDEDRTELAAAALGDLTYDTADGDERWRTTPGDDADPVYGLETTFERTLSTDAVPTWLSVRAAGIWAGPEQSPANLRARGGGGVDGRANARARGRADGDGRNQVAAALPPPVTVSVREYQGGRPPPETVGPADYDALSHDYEWGRVPPAGGPAVLPSPSETEGSGTTDETGSVGTTDGAESVGTTDGAEA